MPYVIFIRERTLDPSELEAYARVFSTYTASNPSIYLDIDRQKTQALGLGCPVVELLTAVVCLSVRFAPCRRLQKVQCR
jgi:hypothetical protein